MRAISPRLRFIEQGCAHVRFTRMQSPRPRTRGKGGVRGDSEGNRSARAKALRLKGAQNLASRLCFTLAARLFMLLLLALASGYFHILGIYPRLIPTSVPATQIF